LGWGNFFDLATTWMREHPGRAHARAALAINPRDALATQLLAALR